MTNSTSSAPSGATMTFDDEFNSLSLWNGTSGTWATNFWYADPNGNGGSLSSNGEQEWYVNSAYAGTSSVTPWTANNGVLTITAASASAAIQAQINGYQITSGELNSYHSFSQTYGYFEMRAQLPSGQGAWPAFWLLPESGAWPPELDIMEVIGNSTTTLYTTVHSNSTGTNVATGVGTMVADTSAGYHTYGVDWETDYVTWYFDGKQVYQVATPSDMHSPMYMIVDLAVGGSWPGNVDTSKPYSSQMLVDYVRAYSSMPASLAAPASYLFSAGGATDATTTDTTSAAAVITASATSLGVQLIGTSHQSVTANNLGDVLVSNDAGSTLIGGSGSDTLYAGRNSDTLTGEGGSDTFVFKYLPWNAGHITDFTPGVDTLDLRPLFSAAGYTGTDPVKDGYLSFVSNGAGGTNVYFNPHTGGVADPWQTLITTLDGVTPSSMTAVQTASPGSGTTTAPNTFVVAAGATSQTLYGSVSETLIGNNAGDTLVSNDYGSTITGGTGADRLVAGHGADTLTGGAGADTFVFKYLPWNAGHVTDFTPGVDKIDVSALFAAAGYHGSDPFADGYLSVGSNGAGGAQILFNPHDGGVADAWPTLITTLDNVLPGAVTLASFVTGLSGGAATAPASSAGAALSLGTAGAYAAQTLVGGGGADTLTAGYGADTLTGGGGADTFQFSVTPWNAGHITDFVAGVDKINIHALLSAAGYAGANPLSDGHVNLVSDGQGDTQVYFAPNGPNSAVTPWPFLITTLDHVAPNSVHVGDFVF